MVGLCGVVLFVLVGAVFPVCCGYALVLGRMLLVGCRCGLVGEALVFWLLRVFVLGIV